MNTYAVAVINFQENDNKVAVVKAKTETEAVVFAVNKIFAEESDEDFTNWVNDSLKNHSTFNDIRQYFVEAEIGVSIPVKI